MAQRFSATTRRRAFRILLAASPALLLVAFWLPGANQGGFRVDTGVYAAIGRHAYLGGSLLDLAAGDTPYWNKPPLVFWVHGALLAALGPSLWVARLPSLVAAILATLATQRLARTLAGPRAAFATGLTLATTLEFFRYTRAISLDLWLTLFMTLGVLAVATAARRDRPALALWAGPALGLALLVKPLVALVVPVILGVWLLWTRRPRFLPWLGGATAVAIVVAAPWHALMIARHGQEFVDVYLLQQSVGRATGETFESRPAWFFLALLFETYWPWLPVFVAALATAPALLRKRPDAARLAIVGFALWLVALSAFAGKHTRYFVPVYPYMALLCGAWLTACAPAWLTRPGRNAMRALAPAALAVSVLVAVVGPRIHAPPEPKWPSLYAFLGEAPSRDTTLWAPPRDGMRPINSNVYLATGRWPRTFPEAGGQAAPGDAPAPGDLILYRERPERRHGPRETDVIVWEEGDLLITRVAAPWGEGPAPIAR